MVRKFLGFLLVLPLLPASAGAAPMSESHGAAGGCKVVGAGKLPADSGGASALCAAVEKAVAARAPGVRYSAEVTVVSKSRLSAKLVANDHALPEQQFNVSDRDLNAAMFERFANAVAEEIAKAHQR